MGKLIDLTGQKFGRLTVLERTTSTNKNVKWLCVCDCGKITSVFGVDLKSGKTKSCGCLFSEQLAQRNKQNALYMSVSKDGDKPQSWRRIYGIRYLMICRCYNPNTDQYSDYGGRGISVCPKWRDKNNGKANFYKWAMSHGYADNLTIDRIDVNGNYEPSNCRWVTMKEQQNNRRNNHLITYNGETKTVAEWELATGIKQHTILQRLRRGWRIEDALTKK